MGFYSNIENAAKNLQKNLTSNDVKEAVCIFAQEVEAAAKKAKKEIDKFSKDWEKNK